jgi:putative ABC transport system ATP-binding protein/macrolide transport system ATP-binding/permease protein/lipoprotein-releasing system ATP-binding protein
MDWWRMLVPFAVGLSVAAAALGGIDWFVARRQRQAVNTIRQQRRLAEEMALQDLRADIDDVVANVDGSFTAALFLDNARSDRNLYVLGPATGMAVQRDGCWESLPTTSSPETMKKIHEVGADRVFIPVTFSVPEGRYDELLRGYLHVRISATMVVSDREDEIRAANGWAPKATVPRWIAMPAH